MHRKLPLPSPAIGVALISLFVALGGTGYAASRTLAPSHAPGKAAGLSGAAASASALAYATVESDGTLRNSEKLRVKKLPGSGAYCVKPTAASGIDPSTVEPVAIPAYQDGINTDDTIQWVDGPDTVPACPPNQGWEIVIEDEGTQSDDAFSIIVP